MLPPSSPHCFLFSHRPDLSEDLQVIKAARDKMCTSGVGSRALKSEFLDAFIESNGKMDLNSGYFKKFKVFLCTSDKL